MARTFKDSLDYDAENVFLSTEVFAESILHYPVEGRKASVAAIVDRDDMLKPPEGSGASRVIMELDGEKGSQLRTWAKVELSKSLDVTFMGTRPDHKQSEFVFSDGTRWKAIAPESSDSSMQTIWCSRIIRATTRKV